MEGGIKCVNCGKAYKSENTFYKKHIESCKPTTPLEEKVLEKSKPKPLADRVKDVEHGLSMQEYLAFIAGVLYIKTPTMYLDIILSIKSFDDKDFIKCIKMADECMSSTTCNPSIIKSVKLLHKKINPAYIKAVTNKS